MAFTERKPGSRWRAGLLTTGARVVPDGRFGRTGAGVADERGAASRAGGRNVSLLALGAIGGAPVAGAGALATGSRLAGDEGIDEMPSHAAPPPSATSRLAAAERLRRRIPVGVHEHDRRSRSLLQRIRAGPRRPRVRPRAPG